MRFEWTRSPLSYRGGPAKRLALIDPAASPPGERDTYFAETKRELRKKNRQRYENPRYEVTPGAEPGTIAFLDFHENQYDGKPSLYLDYVKTRNDRTGQGHARLLFEEILKKYGRDAEYDFGDIMHPAVYKMYRQWQNRGLNVRGRNRDRYTDEEVRLGGASIERLLAGGASMFRTSTLRRLLAEEGLFKTARDNNFDFEGPDFGVRTWRSGRGDDLYLYWPLENIGRRGRRVEVRGITLRGERIAWGPTFMDRVKKARNAQQANAMLDDLKVEIAERGDEALFDRTDTRKGIDKSLPTPSMYRLDDIVGPDITIDLNAKPIEVYSKSDGDKWRNAGNMTYWFRVHPRFKKKLALMRDDLAAARGLDAVEKLLAAEGIPVDYHTYMMPGWD